MLGRSLFFLRAFTMRAELHKVAAEVAAAAPPQPHLRGKTHRSQSPTILKADAKATIFKGVIASLVDIKTERQQF